MNRYFLVACFNSKTLLYVVGTAITKVYLSVIWLVCLPLIVKMGGISNSKIMGLFFFGSLDLIEFSVAWGELILDS